MKLLEIKQMGSQIKILQFVDNIAMIADSEESLEKMLNKIIIHLNKNLI